MKRVYHFLKALFLFVITFKYLIKSYVAPNKITELKQQWALSLLNYLGYSVSRHGNPPPNTQAHVCVGNHISFLDIILLMAVHPEIVFLSKSEVKHWPIIGPAARRVGTLFVNRNDKSNRAELRKQIGEGLQNSARHLAVFPSGTTTLDENIVWKKGIFEIAQQYSIPVYLFKISYTPLRESAYIDDDNLISTMSKMFSLQNKTAQVSWAGSFQIENAEADADKIKRSLIAF
jgi:1-acyl-sn-glycerol-3-phosphate acyltransferase